MSKQKPNESLLATFIRVARMVNTVAGESVEKVQLTAGQPAILTYLADHNGCIQGELARALCIRPATVTINLRGMERARLIYRENDNFDLRVYRVFITERGRALLKEAKRAQNQVQQRCFDGFTPQEIEQLADYLSRVSANLEDVYNKNSPKP